MGSHLFLLFVFMLLLPAGKPDLAADKAALLVFSFAVRGRTLRWNQTHPTPCSWEGVKCDANHVTALRLPGDGLSGQIPSNSIGNLTHLRTLSLRRNALAGHLPPDLASCTELRYLFLQDNRFSGEIPEVLFGLNNLIRLSLAGNNFSGEVSPEFNNLTRLKTLYLESNQLSGSITGLNIPGLEQFNVTSNRLNGSIPSSLRKMPSEAFQGNSLCGVPLNSCPNSGNKLAAGAISGIVIGSVIGSLLILLVLLILHRKMMSGKTKAVAMSPVKPLEFKLPSRKPIIVSGHGGLGNGYSAATAKVGNAIDKTVNKGLVFFGSGVRAFDLEELLKASAEVLGKGTLWTTYMAVLEGRGDVAVKRLKDVSVSEREFREKVEGLGGIGHENLVPLRAYYYSRDEKLLIYEYMPMGSLSALLHGNRGAGRAPLSWKVRSSIAHGAACGIEYLHSQGPNVSHGNIKSSNVLLTNSYGACVSDFGLAQLASPPSAPNLIVGYCAPEVTDARRVSQKADVYSFGVLILELLTGKAPTHVLSNEEEVDLPRWVQSVVQDNWTINVFDLELLKYQNIEEQMVQLLHLALHCTSQNPDKRPSMTQVTRRIKGICGSEPRQDYKLQAD